MLLAEPRVDKSRSESDIFLDYEEKGRDGRAWEGLVDGLALVNAEGERYSFRLQRSTSSHNKDPDDADIISDLHKKKEHTKKEHESAS